MLRLSSYRLTWPLAPCAPQTVDQLHVAAMVLSWVLAIFFVFFMLRPFLRRNKGETTRIAKMLAQLPAEVDIEGLVHRLLLATPDGKKWVRAGVGAGGRWAPGGLDRV